MEIAYLGGVKCGQTTSVLVSYDKSNLEWEVKREKPSQNMSNIRNVNIVINQYEYDVYKLMILTRDQTKKFFYVLNTLDKKQIDELSAEHFNKSDTIGYVF